MKLWWYDYLILPGLVSTKLFNYDRARIGYVSINTEVRFGIGVAICLIVGVYLQSMVSKHGTQGFNISMRGRKCREACSP